MKRNTKHFRYGIYWINIVRTQLQATEDSITNIEQGLIKTDVNSGKKTNRDFIMYGPPGTETSDIMSQLSSRIGVTIVAPLITVVIDGINDVPHLMIFCATNRLHILDEAFLRRLQGNFFTGGPSAPVWKSILTGMKYWHMPPHLLESLTMATTNFSGAALRFVRK